MWLIVGWWRDRTPRAVLMALPLDVASLLTCFLGAIINAEDDF